MRDPSVAVVVPTYNAEQFIAACLHGILSQTRAPDEVIVVDDGSTDSTLGELQRFRSDVVILRQANAGPAKACTRGFRAATSEFVARCDADDIWLPTKLARQLGVLAEYRSVDLAFGGAVNFGAFDGPWDPPSGQGVLEYRPFARDMYRCNPVCTSTVLIRRALTERLGALADLRHAEDYEYWLRALKSGATFYYDREILVRYRRHSANATNDLLAIYRGIYQVHRWHADLVDDPRLVREVLAEDRFRIARWLFENGHPRRARRAFVASLRHRPTVREIAWSAALCAPERYQRPALAGVYAVKHALSAVSAGILLAGQRWVD
jgi:glycosyltransferase involved in cell wall biosynthesis